MYRSQITDPRLGGLGSALATFGSIAGLRAASPIPRFAEDLLDQAVLGVGRQRLVLVNDLITTGLVTKIDNWMSYMTFSQRRTNNAGNAQRAMVPSQGQRFVVDGDYVTIPLFTTWSDFSFDIREILEAERVGAPLDVSHVEQATWNVNAKIEDQGINGAGVSIKGHSAPGALTNPSNTSHYTGNEAWTAAGHTGADILADVQAMQNVSIADNYYGPWNLYVPRLYATKLDTDFKDFSDLNIRQRLLELEGIQSIKTVDFLPADTTLLVQMTRNVVDVVIGQTPAQVSWQDGPGWHRFWVVLACMVVRWKADMNGGQGFVVGTPGP